MIHVGHCPLLLPSSPRLLDKLFHSFLDETPEQIAARRRAEAESSHIDLSSAPDGLSPRSLAAAKTAGPLVSLLLFMHSGADGHTEAYKGGDTVPEQQKQHSVWSRGTSAVVVRLAVISAAVLAWLALREDVVTVVLRWLGPEPDLLLAATAPLSKLLKPHAAVVALAHVSDRASRGEGEGCVAGLWLSRAVCYAG